MNYKMLDWLPEIHLGVLPHSFFFFEGLLWVILIGFPLVIFWLWKYKKLTLSPSWKRKLILGIGVFALLGLVGASNIWLFLAGLILTGVIKYLEIVTSKYPRALAFLLFLGWGCVVQGSYFESQKLVVREFDLEIPEFPSMRIAVVADIHVGPYKGKGWVRRVINQINHFEKIEGVMIPGDLVYGAASHYASELEPLRDLQAPAFVTLGNHDHFKDPIRNAAQSRAVNQNLEAFGIKPFNNRSEFWEEKGIWIVGLDDNDLGYHDLKKALESIDPEKPFLLLAHSPDIMDELETDASVFVLSGHTHCGQIRLPLLGALPLTIPTVNGKKYERHYYREEDKHLFITCGVGEVGPRARFFNPPEIAVLNINKAVDH